MSVANSPASRRSVLAPTDWLALCLMCAALAGGLIWQFRTGINPDATWLTVVAERWLAGERLYIDLLENNPPASIYLYVPPVVLARITGVSAELLVQCWFLVIAALSIESARRMLVHSGFSEKLHLPWLGLCICALFFLMPAATFAQREHAAALLALPVIALATMRVAGCNPSVWMIAIGGLAAGIIATLKPPMIAVVVFVYGAAAIHCRDWRVIFAKENWIAAAIFLLYGMLVYRNHPEFFEIILPLLNDVYIPNSFLKLLIILPTFYVIVFLLMHILTVHRSDLILPPGSLVFAAAAGFLASYFVQGKFFDYHAMPVSIYLLLGMCVVLCGKAGGSEAADAGRSHRPQWEFYVTIGVAVICGVWNFYLFYGGYYRGALTRALSTIGSAPSALAMTTHLGPYMREVRRAGGSWAGSFGQTFVPGFNAWFRGNLKVSAEWEKRLAIWEQWTVNNLEKDLVKKRPDLVIIVDEHDFDWRAWYKGKPQLAKAMAQYRLAHTVRFNNGIYPLHLYVRKGGGNHSGSRLPVAVPVAKQ